MHIFTTSSCVWLRQGVAEALADDGVQARVTTITSLASPEASGLLSPGGSEQRVILLTFPPRRPTVCLRSMVFLLEWLKASRHLRCTGHIPCILWGSSQPDVTSGGLLSGTGLPVIPWKVQPHQLRQLLRRYADSKQQPAHRVSCRLTHQEAAALRYSLEGDTLEQAAVKMGINKKTVWTHRRNALEFMGVRRPTDLAGIGMMEVMQVATSTPTVSALRPVTGGWHDAR
ncbi:TPA: hypothetical protein G8S33_003849 [Salmonella enterica]|uniref:Bacterial regulatory proteins, luxR family n=2 Tax=Salmonella enterica TaxID=28901 RepID=A0A379SDQ9_SALER|nr:hypothetical protein [Salmonella enterica]EBR0172630.1 hypothetical protein [Salmonella enterica subsp. enterica serovar Mikawasima]EBW5295443.1 hypothetical protein [Salmonella enterica subsp. enterica serovar Newport]EBY1555905.1 hypothetical protein [Salmonella enterica subsp. enterica serovar Hofit]EBY7517544.1 hypothetical protein [Salmonella enterica subsp. enterica serovar Richmond]ECC9557130.1 hypothetical protein [Salmonella enterica subsp. salamae]ECY4825867.1 hypothetical protei